MIFKFKNLKDICYKLKPISYKLNAGMTYVELIVVLSIFSVLSSVVIFNYGNFQAKVDIKNLASDIALEIVQAQKSSLSGLLPIQTPMSSWKPSYGVYFLPATDNKSFIYFADLDNGKTFDGSSCPTATLECLNKISITKGNSISGIKVFYRDGSSTSNLPDLTITFSRPDSGAVIVSSSSLNSNISYAQITIVSPKGTSGVIKLYSSGRVQIN